MSSFQPKSVLLVDHRKPRANAIAATLKKIWAAETEVVRSFDAAIQIALSHDMRFDVVIVAFGVGDYRRLLKELCPKPQAHRLLLTDDVTTSYPSNVPPGFAILISPTVAPNDQLLVNSLQPYMGPRPPQLASVNHRTWPSSLASQVRWLNSDGDLLAGKKIIQHLVWQLDPAIRKFQLIQLNQGFSGASVFRLGKIERDAAASTPSDLVLKLTPINDHQAYKCRHELENHEQIKKSFNKGLVKHVPDLIARLGGEPAECDDWLAVMYECVSHEDLCVVDLERAAIEPEKCLTDARPVSRELAAISAGQLTGHVLGKLFDVLGRWYEEDKARSVQGGPLWAVDDAIDKTPPMFPPYRFTSWERNELLKAVFHLDQYGQSLPAANWDASRRKVLQFVGIDKAPKLPVKLTSPQPLLLSRVHGDLNANNVLFELQNGLVQFIDFACFQKQGHLLQDLARLEVAIKIELMGRELGGPDGHDLNTTEFGFWCEAEKWLQNWPDGSPSGPDASGISESARRTFDHCVSIRRFAEEIHSRLTNQTDGQEPEFHVSYNAALLYHTVRSIRFASRPHLKRIFAVHSARLLIERLDEPDVTSK